MSHLREIKRTRGPIAGYDLYVENYEENPEMGRFGIWVGAKYYSIESVTLSIRKPDDGEFWVFGFDSQTATYWLPFELEDFAPRLIKGSNVVTYDGTVGDEYHVTLAIAAGADKECHTVYAILARPNGPEPADKYDSHYVTSVCLTGYEIVWPNDKLEEQRRWLRNFKEKIGRHVPVPLFGVPQPPQPVEVQLAALRGNEVIKVRATVDEIERLERAGGQDDLLRALKSGLTHTLGHALTRNNATVSTHTDGLRPQVAHTLAE
ncbi:hypothetical protein [Rhodococcus opacus]|jgi:hypothetical protein|uniref:hypothetical protein n=1 Tax=Rhodococcus opacus TaxID=37919 RepID=UPI000EA8D499|nr:hypothetical protein [Rhodococcus opacus]QZS56837.1 hypothetical protein FXW36_07110 [Rhodococcus opacus]RKM76537.1 hypothetical protein COO55_34080 [Rhodococcus opacus]